MTTLSSSLKLQKRALRRLINERLDVLHNQAVEEQSKAVVDQLFSLPAFRRSKTVSCYLSMPSKELKTDLIVSELLSLKKTLFVPKIRSKDGYMEFLKIYGTEDLSTLPVGLWGIKEPGSEWKGERRANVLDPACEPLDIILVPGVAFDRSLSRLGHGKGYYDRFISTYISSGRPRPLLVGLALRAQLLGKSEIPMDEHDWRMDIVLTPDGVFSDTDPGVQ